MATFYLFIITNNLLVMPRRERVQLLLEKNKTKTKDNSYLNIKIRRIDKQLILQYKFRERR